MINIHHKQENCNTNSKDFLNDPLGHDSLNNQFVDYSSFPNCSKSVINNCSKSVINNCSEKVVNLNSCVNLKEGEGETPLRCIQYNNKCMSKRYIPLLLKNLQQEEHHEIIQEIIHIIITKNIEQQLGMDAFVRLKWQYIRDRFQKVDIKSLLTYMETLGTIEVDKKYIIGKHCRGYRLTEKYREFEVMSVKAPQRRFLHSPVTQWLTANLDRISIVCECYKPRDDFGWRYHSTLTNTTKNIIDSLRADGEPLAEIDIANSQALMLCSLFMKYKVQSPKFVELCQSGELYNVIANDIKTTRDKAKEAFISKILCGTHKAKSKVIGWMEQNYPEVLNLIKKIKKTDYKRLGRLLQRAEASIVIYGVSDLIRKTHPDMFLATRHDSFLCKPQDQALVIELLEKECAKFNIIPKVKVK